MNKELLDSKKHTVKLNVKVLEVFFFNLKKITFKRLMIGTHV